MIKRSTLALLALATLVAPAAAQDSGSFVVRLGRDTTAFERYTRTATRLEIEQVGRVPRVLTRRYVYELAPSGVATRVTVTVTDPGAAEGAPPVQQIDAVVTGDSLITTVRRDTSVQVIRAGAPAGSVLFFNSAPWTLYEAQTMGLAKQGGDSLRSPMVPVGGTSLAGITARRLGPDSMVIQTTNDRYHAKVDKQGRIQGVTPISGTQGYNVLRAANLDIARETATWAAREKASGAMGQLSTRDTVNATAGGAALWVDYSRPSKRGRVIYGNVVPLGQVWRTGANAATQFRTDKALQFGDITVPAGSYSLFTIPGPKSWTLIVNSETGQTGTAHKPEKDLVRIPMVVSTLPQSVERFTIGVTPGENGGNLNLDWDTTRASAAFRVAP